MGIRRTARECVLQILFQTEFQNKNKGDAPELNVDVEKKMVSQVKVFANQLLEGVLAHQQKIDDIIERYAKNWSKDRMAIVDRNILRFSIYELLYLPEIPSNVTINEVTINEAIEIAKNYGNENSGAFINGILDRIQGDFQKTNAKKVRESA